MYHSDLAISIATMFSKHSKNIFWSVHHSIDDISKEKFTSRVVIRFLKLISKQPRNTVYVSRISKQQHEALGYSTSNSVLIPNGYDLELFKKDASLRARFRNEFGIPDDQFVVGNLARFHIMKDHEAFLDAAALFSSKHSNCGFIIAGRGTDNEPVSYTHLTLPTNREV